MAPPCRERLAVRVFELTTRVTGINRGDGRSATASAAYRACCEIECEREGKTHDYGRKQGLEASEIVLPQGAPAWAKDRAKLWNAAELVEQNRRQARQERREVQGGRQDSAGRAVYLSIRVERGGQAENGADHCRVSGQHIGGGGRFQHP